MPSRDERLDAIARNLGELGLRLAAIEERLDRLEGKSPRPAEEPAPPPPLAPPPPPPPSQAPAAPAAVPDVEKPRVLETRMGLTWINRVAVVTCILAVAFFFKYAVDNEWIGETGRVALGVIAGLLTLGVAERLWQKGQQIYAQGLCGLGAAILYVSFYAAFGFYELLPRELVFVLMVGATVATGALAFRYSSIAMAALALFGGYVTPILLSSGEDRPWFLFTYVTLLNLGALALSRLRNWWALNLEAFAATWFLYFAWISLPVEAHHRLPATVFALVFYCVFVITGNRWLICASQAVVAALMGAILRDSWTAYFLLVVALTFAGLALADRRKWSWMAPATFLGFALSLAIFEIERTGVPLGPSLAYLTVAFLLFLGWMGWRLLVRHSTISERDLALLVANAAVYFGASYALLDEVYDDYLGLFTVVVAAVHLVAAWLFRRAQDNRPAIVAIGVAIALFVLAAPIQFSGFRITIAWALQGAALTWIAKKTNERRLAWPGLAVLTLTFLALFISDAWIYSSASEYSLLVNERFLTFSVAATALWLAAWWTPSENEPFPSAPVVLYVAGHFTAVWALGQEVLGWAGRSAAAENLTSVQSASLSILLAAYAVVLVAIGVVKRSPLDRVLGLGLIALVVVKLYLYDVWELRTIYRVTAFGALGALLLAMSYLYSRFRSSIESWWKG